jgi:AcrR family transcriptional regulator
MTARKSASQSFVWSRKRAPTRGPKPGLTTNEIAHAAIRIADTEGLAAVTMQRLARHLGVTTMALYRYFPGKAELLALMIESAGGPDPRFGKPSAPWHARLRVWARRCAAIYRDHPWFLEATTLRQTVMGPNELSWMEAALAMLAEAGLPPKERYYAFLAIIGLIRGHATFEQIKKRQQSPRKWARGLGKLLRTKGDQFSALQETLESGALAANPRESFEYALTCILDGISPTSRARAATRLKH